MTYLARNINVALACFIITLPALPALGGELDIPNQFSAGTAAVAADVNANFSAVETSVDGNAADIAILQTTIAALQADNTAMQNFITQVLPYLQGGSDAQGNPTVFFSGVNVHVNNSDPDGETQSINGTGNLIIGFDESIEAGIAAGVDVDGRNFCYDVSTYYDNSTDCISSGGQWSNGLVNIKTGSHNLIVGSYHSYTSSAGAVLGVLNIANNEFSLVAGSSNLATGLASSVSGGTTNTANGLASSVSGGAQNIASGFYNSVSGGLGNTASGNYSSVSGGLSNEASGSQSSVSGGSSNEARGDRSSVSGGYSGAPEGDDDWVAGDLFQDD